MKDRTYFKNLDVLRFITFILVFFNHCFFTNNPSIQASYLQWQTGYAGIAACGLDFFSVLSSFLITWLILREYKEQNSFKLGNFLTRRILRIWPLYFVIVFIGYVVVPAFSELTGSEPPQLPPVIWFFTFTSNYYTGYVSQDYLFFLVFLWFIAVEEQFYLLWGVILKFLHRYVNLIFFTLLGSSLLVKIAFGTNTFPSFFDTINYIPNFVTGAFLAKSFVDGNKIYRKLKEAPRIFWYSVYLALVVVLFFQNFFFNICHLENIKHLILSILFGLILFENCFAARPLFNLSKYGVVNYFGTLNYGLYCWHGVVITILIKLLKPAAQMDSLYDVFFLYPMVALVLTAGISILSYELFEKRFLRLKKYFGGIAHR